MALIDGDDFVSGSILSYQEANRLKNHWRSATPPSSPSPGMLFSDSDDDKLYHHEGGSGGGWDEVLQENNSLDARPRFDNLYLSIAFSDVSDPPTDAQLDALFPGVGNGFIGFVRDTTSGGSLWMIIYDVGSGWWYLEMSHAL